MFTCNIGAEREKIGRKYVWMCVYVCMYSRAYVSMINKTKKGQLPLRLPWENTTKRLCGDLFFITLYFVTPGSATLPYFHIRSVLFDSLTAHTSLRGYSVKFSCW